MRAVLGARPSERTIDGGGGREVVWKPGTRQMDGGWYPFSPASPFFCFLLHLTVDFDEQVATVFLWKHATLATLAAAVISAITLCPTTCPPGCLSPCHIPSDDIRRVLGMTAVG